jgi:predicted acylesterase/phospholipase RssA
MKTALVLSGGGSRGAFAVGAVEVLWERGWKFDIISGTSTGALIASLATINDIETLVKIYTSVQTKDILRLNWRRLFHDAVYDTKPLEKLARRAMKGARYDALMASPVTALLCRVGFQTGGVLYGSQRPMEAHTEIQPWGDFEGYIKALLASTNEPTLMPPVCVGGETCFDGGVREVVPFRIVKALGAEKIVVVTNGPSDPSPDADRFSSLIHIGPRALDLMTTEIANDDLLGADADVIIIRPTSPLPGSALRFVPAEMQQMRKIGQARAKEVLVADACEFRPSK